MREVIRKAILLGLGGYQYMKEGVEGFVQSLEKEGKLSPEEGKKLIDEMREKAKENAKKETEAFRDSVRKVMNEVGVATKKDIEDLKKEIRK
ncbi:hypothetical protein GF357_04625 [Candidatus Dojkabacteria bacterium]|nr:hypothetical protein [Candidatus Dojkabacteria bacterium]